MRIKKSPVLIWIISLVVVFTLTPKVYTQSLEAMVSEIVSKMKEELNLDEDQVRQVKSIVKEDLRSRQELFSYIQREEAKLMEFMQNQAQKINNRTELQLSQYLTQEQMSQWWKIQQEQEKKLYQGK